METLMKFVCLMVCWIVTFLCMAIGFIVAVVLLIDPTSFTYPHPFRVVVGSMVLSPMLMYISKLVYDDTPDVM